MFWSRRQSNFSSAVNIQKANFKKKTRSTTARTISRQETRSVVPDQVTVTDRRVVANVVAFRTRRAIVRAIFAAPAAIFRVLRRARWSDSTAG